MHARVCSLVGAVLLSAALPCQVFIVDEAMGPGADFADLPEAVAAVPDRATLRVRAGAYTTFAIDGKGLSIVGDARGTARLSKVGVGLRVLNTDPSQLVLIKNLAFDSTFVLGNAIVIADCRGPVVFEAFDARSGTSAVFFVATSSDNVQLHRCVFDDTGPASTPRVLATDAVLHVRDSAVVGPPAALGLIGATAANPAVWLIRSRAIAVRSSLTGGRGAQCCVRGTAPGTPGAPGALVVDNSELILLRSSVTGGQGADPTPASPFGPPFPGGAGGVGIDVQGGSTVRFEGTEPVGGPPGPGAEVSGAPFAVDASSTLLIDPAAEPSAAELTGTPARGQTLGFVLDAAPGSAGVLLLANQGQLVPVEPLALGSLLFPFQVSLPTAVPATGVAEIAYTIPATRPLGVTNFGQFATLHPTSQRIWVTNALAIHVNQ